MISILNKSRIRNVCHQSDFGFASCSTGGLLLPDALLRTLPFSLSNCIGENDSSGIKTLKLLIMFNAARIAIKSESFALPFSAFNTVLRLIHALLATSACVISRFNRMRFKRSPNTDAIYTGLSNTRWPGRLECVSKTPLIYIDGGHNIDCIKRVCEFVNALNYSHKRVIISISAGIKRIAQYSSNFSIV